MRYIFVDESRIEKGRYQLFGSLWLSRDKAVMFRNEFWGLWDNEFPSRKSELKWTKVSKGKLETYKKFINFFLNFSQVDFRCVVLDRHTIDYREYHEGDEELGFYKFLYFFLSRNIEKDYKYREVQDYYQIFIDARRKKDSVEVGRLEDLKFCLNSRLWKSCLYKDFRDSRSNGKMHAPSKNDLLNKPIRNVEAIDSRQSPEIQLVDVLMGAVGYKYEGFQTSYAKLNMVAYIEELFGLQLDKSTPYLTEKINIWEFRLQNKQKSAPLPTPQRG